MRIIVRIRRGLRGRLRSGNAPATRVGGGRLAIPPPRSPEARGDWSDPSAVTELRARYSARLPAIFDELMEMAMDNSQPPLAQLAAIRLVLDYLLGRPQVTGEATS